VPSGKCGTLIADEPMPDPVRAAELGVSVVPTMSNYVNQQRQLTALVDALAAGRIRAPQIEILPLEQVAEAHRRIAGGHVRGKIILEVHAGLAG
jgi:NADPH:quinone reductase-like Zn-dependent oxidoreductase